MTNAIAVTTTHPTVTGDRTPHAFPPGAGCQFTGRHIIAEMVGVSPALLDDEPHLLQLLHQALTAAQATILHILSHRFTPQGVTVLALLSESHASIHTYPEARACFVDIFTCGQSTHPERALVLLVEAMRPAHAHWQTITRGVPTVAAPGPPSTDVTSPRPATPRLPVPQHASLSGSR
jgi:S-adenosylmethionine decarboxylase